jgi:hypothetical protein
MPVIRQTKYEREIPGSVNAASGNVGSVGRDSCGWRFYGMGADYGSGSGIRRHIRRGIQRAG